MTTRDIEPRLGRRRLNRSIGSDLASSAAPAASTSRRNRLAGAAVLAALTLGCASTGVRELGERSLQSELERPGVSRAVLPVGQYVLPVGRYVFPVGQYVARTGWDVVAEEEAYPRRRCSDNFDDDDRLGFDHGGTNTKRPTHRGVDIQANEGAPVYAWQGGKLAAHRTYLCGLGVNITHLDGSKTTYCHFSQVKRTRGWIRTGDVIGKVGDTGNATGPHVHIAHKRPGRKGKLVEYFTLTVPMPTQFTPESEGGC